ncbi:unnamed protein product [Adineta steineri]|uniref:Uncharacterized protein n=1 Tax=Adineta steineri TaxID=433720 RepID=A0A814FX14_9BILA|nr:unnamed protein product [Adineta steineri]CAF3514829.1 unnamed protein product [Adineta steineri]
MTCYIHLQCNRGSSFACLDWSEICNGIIDCMDGIDEQYCWLMEIHECQPNEYQCYNRQCKPKAFFQDNKNFPDCLDGSDERYDGSSNTINKKKIYEPIFLYEDILCLKYSSLYYTSSTRSLRRIKYYQLPCQMFTRYGFGHSLDALLGYHILPHINIFHQPTIVKISITFREKALRTNGCAFYLLASPIAS